MPRGRGRPFRPGGGQKAVGQGAQVDFKNLGELPPERRVVYPGGRLGKKVAPIVGGSGHRAGPRVQAGCDHMVSRRPQGFMDTHQGAAHFPRPRLDPDHLVGRRSQGREFGCFGFIQFGQNMIHPMRWAKVASQSGRSSAVQ
jgi:hypothetical protein